MDAIEPVHSTGVLLLIAAAAVAALLFLIMKVKLHAFIALVLVSLVTAVAAGIPLGDVPKALTTGFNTTLGSVALLVAFGVMLGRLLEVTGGAQVLADTLINRFGDKRAPLALGVAALVFGFPIFFDAGLVVFLPIIYTVARRFGGSILLYGLPTAGAFAVMHAVIPPHPGPVAAVELMGGNVGTTLLLGVPVALLSWAIGAYPLAIMFGRRVHIDVPTAIFGEENGGRDVEETRGRAPRFGTVLLLLLLPLLLISLNTVVSTLQKAGTLAEDTGWGDALILLGQTPIALLITTIVAIALLAPGRFSVGRASDIAESGLGPVCSIILITGAGGMFGGVLRASGIGESLTTSLSGLGLSLIVQAFLVSAALRVAQGSATVALTTTAGLIATQVAAEGLDAVHIACLVFAIAGGATVLAHVNDSGFWLVSRFFNMDVKTTLKTWTVIETALGTTVFLLASLVWVIA